MAPRSNIHTVLRVYLEEGPKRICAASMDYPGWLRFAKTESGAIEALEAHHERFAAIARAAGDDFPAAFNEVRVVERIQGDATTDFGAPSQILSSDSRSLSSEEASRLAAYLRAAWDRLDVLAAHPVELSVGPRGGGRSHPQIVSHVLEAERHGVRKIGVRVSPAEFHADGGLIAFREATIDAIRTCSTETAWPIRYAARRLVWHVLDHCWELENRALSPLPASNFR
jgi:hypothetical protein